MTSQQPSPATRWSRRSVLGLLGAAPLAASGVLSATGAAHADPPGSGPPPGAVPKDLRPGGAFDKFVAQRAAQDQFSGTVLLAHRGRPVLTRSHGMANQQQSIPNRPDTIFNLASVTKSLTAVAVAQLAEQGKLALYEKLGAYLDGFPAKIANQVTVHHLLTHTSGLGDYSQSGEFASGIQQWSSVAEVMDGVMAIIRKTPPPRPFRPGHHYAYSNSGFFVLGAIVERVSGQSYFDYVRRQIFAPAGMSRSDFFTKPQVLARDDIARPYATQRSGGRGDFTASPYFGFIGGPADGAYSTVSDLLRLAAALRAGRLLSPAFASLTTSGKVPLSPSDPPVEPERDRFYGYGFRDTAVSGQRVFGHSGSGAGKATNFDVHPDLDWVAVVLSNYDTSVDPIVQLERQLITQQGA
jgi:CubicO group peptidase (beta-lactamase class C family)